MKRNYFGNVSLASLFLLATTAAAFGQSALKANIPFAFSVGNSQMPAGHYLFSEDPVRKTITIHNLDTKAAIETQAQLDVARGQDRFAMQFHRYGSEYFLTSVHGGTDNLDLTIPATQKEKVAKSTMMAAAIPSQKPNLVQIAAR
jgi:hypothetical protein